MDYQVNPLPPAYVNSVQYSFCSRRKTAWLFNLSDGRICNLSCRVVVSLRKLQIFCDVIFTFATVNLCCLAQPKPHTLRDVEQSERWQLLLCFLRKRALFANVLCSCLPDCSTSHHLKTHLLDSLSPKSRFIGRVHKTCKHSG